MILINSAQSILSIVLMIGIGYVLTLKKWFDANTSKLFSKIVVNIALPALMLSNLLGTFTRQNLSQAGIGILIPFISMLASFAVSIILSKLLKVSSDRKGTFQTMFFLSNTIFIGLPVNLALFGEASVPFVLYYYFSNTTIFWTLGVYLIRKDGGADNFKLLSVDAIKKILNPPLLGFLLALALIFLNIKLPSFIMDTCKYLGNLTTPLSMLFIGITINSISFKNFKFDKSMFGVLAGRFLVSPLITYIFAILFSADKLMKSVFLIQSALPVMANAAIITKEYNADYEYASIMIAVTTIASLFFIPIYRFIAG